MVSLQLLWTFVCKLRSYMHLIKVPLQVLNEKLTAQGGVSINTRELKPSAVLVLRPYIAPRMLYFHRA